MKVYTKGFTLIEILVSVACLAIILGMAIPAYTLLQVRNDLDIATNTVASSFRRAQALSSASYGDMTWGVYIATGSILIYKGASYATRDVLYDERVEIAQSIGVSGLTDVLFLKMTGEPNSSGTTTLTSIRNETRSITINKKGMVNF
ncbi:MAG: hypothetical protein RLZZ308_606 [Candidatus Parcubacteria bacterium]|jgi:prepilin-type N-terminal cleavage/methylation domain-containing protein